MVGGKIPAGVSFAGKFNVFGYKSFLKLQVSFDEQVFLVVADMDPIDWSIIKMTRNFSDRKKGPKFCVDIKVNDLAINIDIEGYLEVWGMGAYAKLQISPAKINTVIEVDMFGLNCMLSMQATLPFEAGMTASSFLKSKFEYGLQIKGPALKLGAKLAKTVKERIVNSIKRLTGGAESTRASARADLGISEEEGTAVANWYLQYDDLGEDEFMHCLSTECRHDALTQLGEADDVVELWGGGASDPCNKISKDKECAESSHKCVWCAGNTLNSKCRKVAERDDSSKCAGAMTQILSKDPMKKMALQVQETEQSSKSPPPAAGSSGKKDGGAKCRVNKECKARHQFNLSLTPLTRLWLDWDM